jgi:hypothetical protein
VEYFCKSTQIILEVKVTTHTKILFKFESFKYNFKFILTKNIFEAYAEKLS